MLNVSENNNKICRLCLGRRANHGLFNDSIIEKIHSCCTLQIFKNDGLPEHICEDCLNTLDLFVNFRNQCELNDRVLRESLGIKPLKCEVDSVKVEYSSDQDFSELPDYTSDHLGEVPSFEDIFTSQENKKKSKKSLGILRKRKCKIKNDLDLNDSQKEDKEKTYIPNEVGLCPFCGKIFDKIQSLNGHVKRHNAEKKHKCVKCEKLFLEPRMLREHERTHLNTRDFPCEMCGKLFATKSSAKKHLEIVHKKSKVVQCGICNKVLTSTQSLKGHIKTHTGEKQYQCDYCEQCFAFKCSLVVHLRCHTGEKPYRCKHCGTKFAALKTATEHERLHTGETPYICPVCSKGFSQRSNMKSHFRNNHKGVEITL